MKILNCFTLAISLMIFASCKKDKPGTDTGPTPIPVPVDTTHIPPTDNDTALVLLKDVVSTSLPTPYYHFEYDADKYVQKISFAAGLDIYNLEYTNRKLNKMTNINHGNELNYTYTNNNVSLITETSASGTLLWKYFLKYNSRSQLTEIKWLKFENGTDSFVYRKVILSYHPDGNLSQREDFRIDAGNQLNWSTTTQYSDYDTGKNVDGFSICKDFFESLIYLPAVQLQKNNHRTETIVGPQNDYRITYVYQYNNGLPIKETGTMIQTRGGGGGQVLVFSNQFSFY